ncbi:MAG TPA: SEC-C metal-binding domain-containing protein, partial [Candidatus Hydrogenedentes bacterium]|nr:SEC-C metal-binding domain-containing protein [Candidatus Hydrogenedentota bacterium]
LPEQVGGDDAHIDFQRVARKRIHDLELMVLLRTVDDYWIKHLYEMDYLRESVNLRAFGQKDPLLEYKQEGLELFQEMIRDIEETVTQMLFRLTDPEQSKNRAPGRPAGPDPYKQLSEYAYISADKQADRSFASMDTSRFMLGGKPRQVTEGGQTPVAEAPKQKPVRVADKTGPNDPCPCGSGKKYKKCCGKLNF